jgi:cysteine-rich repeat protein
LGFDLDGVCSNAPGCAGLRDLVSCRPTHQQIPSDANGCRDNEFANAFAIISHVPEVGGRFGLDETSIDCGLWRGSYNVIVRVTDYNGRADDDHVRVDWYASAGIDPQPSWLCPTDDFQNRYPLWRKTSTWPVDEQDLSEPVLDPKQLPLSRIADQDAYVRDHYLVSRFPDGASLRLPGDGQPFRGLALAVHQGIWTGRLSQAPDGTWRITDGLVGGRVRTEDALQSLRQTGFCLGKGVDTLYTSMATYIQENADLLAVGDNDADQPCDALSLGIGFEAAELTPAAVSSTLPPLIECCEPGMSARDCRAICGDGVRSGSESCDIAIAPGQPGACATSCASRDACNPQVVSGTSCDAHCVPQPIRSAQAGDGCCPEGADSSSDPDCAPSCGNGVIEAGETCDRGSEKCPACTVTDPCLTAVASGAADSCTADCTYTSINSCYGGDGCCPKGCSPDTDRDCSARCGDGVVDRMLGETCEPAGNLPCPTHCDDADPCTTDIQTGSAANCNLTCTHVAIAKAKNGDACCPKGANANVDSDCASTCGNGALESGEECDDGGRFNGDGCSDMCRRETKLQVCLQRVGPQQPGSDQQHGDACAQCACTNCAKEADACYGAADHEEVRLCDQLVECVRATWCNGEACYCGPDLLSCSLGNPTGPCRKEVQEAAGTSLVSTILARGSDTSGPLGRANALGSCAWQHCAKECNFK